MSSETEQDIQRSLGRLEGKMDSVCSSIKELRATIEGQSHRLASVEKWRTRVKSYSAGAGAVLAVVLGLFWRALSLLNK
jgi:hypothetical protein